MVDSVGGLPPLQLGVQRQDLGPQPGGIVEVCDASSGVGHEKPRPLLVVGNNLRHEVRPAGEELGRQPGLERLHRAARLEPNEAAVGRYTEHRRPGSLVRDFDVATGSDLHTDPVLSNGPVHAATIAPQGPGGHARCITTQSPFL